MESTEQTNHDDREQFRQKISETVRRYLDLFPDEQQRQQTLIDFLDNPTLDLRLRSTIPEGHLCASGIILLPDSKILMLEHKALGIWVVPGGHYDISDQELAATAIRETTEETGLEGILLHPWHIQHAIPIDIDTHPIPARPEKNEAAHQHFDFRYILQVEDSEKVIEQLSLQAAEILSFKAFSVDEVSLESSITPALGKLRLLQADSAAQ